MKVEVINNMTNLINNFNGNMMAWYLIYIFSIVLAIVVIAKINNIRNLINNDYTPNLLDAKAILSKLLQDIRKSIIDSITNNKVSNENIQNSINEINNKLDVIKDTINIEQESTDQFEVNAKYIDDLKYKISIYCKNEEDKINIGNTIHEQLIGNQDYINNSIILDIDDNKTINLYIFNEVENIPSISIFDEKPSKTIKSYTKKKTKSAGKRGGPKLKELPKDADKILEKWLNGEITSKSAAKLLKISIPTFYRRFNSMKKSRQKN